MRELHALHLAEHQLARAYPLVRSSVHVSQAGWEGFARSLIADGGGIIGVEVDEDCLYGVATYRPLKTLRHERLLDSEVFVAIDFSPTAPVRRILHERLEQIARSSGCRNIRITMTAPGRDALISREYTDWEALGLQMNSVGLVQQLC